MDSDEKTSLPPMFAEDIRHEVDSLLAATILLVQQGKLPGQAVWFCLSGSIMFGHLVSEPEGYATFFNVPDGTPPPSVESKETILPFYGYLKDVRLFHPGGGVTESRIARIKLSHVSAWGFGMADL